MQESGNYSKDLSGLFKKRASAVTESRVETAENKTSATRRVAVLDFIIDNAQEDERPYLKLKILGHHFFGLLDSGESRTFIGSKRLCTIKNLGIPLVEKETVCKLANRQKWNN